MHKACIERHSCEKERLEGYTIKGKYVTQMFALLQAIWLKGSKTTYITKKLMLLMLMVKEGKQIDWSIIFFYNLYSCIWDFSAPSKLKDTIGKDLEFGLAHVIDILL